MITPELISYIQIERTKGLSDAAIRSTLISQGWLGEDFDEAVAQMNGTSTKKKFDPVLRKHRVRWGIFSFVLSMIFPFVYLFSVYPQNISIQSLSALVPVLGICSAPCALIIWPLSRFMKPSQSVWVSILLAILFGIVADALTVFLIFAFIYITCTFLLRGVNI